MSEFEFDYKGMRFKFALDDRNRVRTYQWETRLMEPQWDNLGLHDGPDDAGIKALLANRAEVVALYREAMEWARAYAKIFAEEGYKEPSRLFNSELDALDARFKKLEGEG